MCYNYCMLYQHLLVRNGYEQTSMNGLKAKKKHTSMNTMFYQQKKKHMGYFFPLKKNFSKNMPLSIFTLIKAAHLHVWVQKKSMRSFPGKVMTD